MRLLLPGKKKKIVGKAGSCLSVMLRATEVI